MLQHVKSGGIYISSRVLLAMNHTKFVMYAGYHTSSYETLAGNLQNFLLS
jgi:hypothetical protein